MSTAAGRQPAPHSRFFSATLTDSDPELELWGARRKRELFERVYDRDVEVTTQVG